jgi:hypothetical protein
MSRPATPTAAPANATVPSTFLRCFRGAASFNALARVWDGKTAKVEEIHDEMGHKFFGQVKNDTLSSLNKLIKGEEAFYALFDEHPSPSGPELVTKPHLILAVAVTLLAFILLLNFSVEVPSRKLTALVLLVVHFINTPTLLF